MSQLKRQHSSASLGVNTPKSEAASPQPSGETPSNVSTTPPTASAAAAPGATLEAPKPTPNTLEGGFVGSPLKKQRASVSQADEHAMRRRIESGLSQQVSGVLDSAGTENPPAPGTDAKAFGESLQPPPTKQPDEEEEL